MSDLELMTRDDVAQVILWSGKALELRQQALAAAALIGRVTDAATNENATRALENLHRLMVEVEKARVGVKAPLLFFGRKIDGAVMKFLEDVGEEKVRLAALLGDYAEVQRLRQQAEEQAANQRLTELERARAEEVAKAASIEEADAINEKYSEAARGVEPVPPPPKPKGQVIKEDWDIQVTDIWLLARSHPTCVKMEAVPSEIKTLLSAGVKLKGVTAQRVTKASVRLTPQPQAIEV